MKVRKVITEGENLQVDLNLKEIEIRENLQVEYKI